MPGYKNGSGGSAQFFYPVGIAVDADGTIFVADRANHRVRKVTSKGNVSTLAGSGRNAVVDGKGEAASFAWPNAIALDPSGRGAVYVSDTFAFRIRKITRDGQTRTICIGPAPPPKQTAAHTPTVYVGGVGCCCDCVGCPRDPSPWRQKPLNSWIKRGHKTECNVM